MMMLIRLGWRLLKYLLVLVVALVAIVAVGYGVVSRSFADLRPWHRIAPAGEFTARDLAASTTLADYVARENAILTEVARDVSGAFTPGRRDTLQRYAKDSPVNPATFPVNWNRTFELTPPEIRGGALLVHGMTDSPYSMRAIARVLQDEGYYCVAMRMPGHGTVPAGLAKARWQDWAAAVRLGARHVRAKVGADKPLLLVGYSNGGALVVNHALEALGDSGAARPDRLVLVSPMIGVKAAAGLSNLISLLHGVPYFEKAAWTSVLPEYNPFKYNSFPAAAGMESHRLTRELDRKVAAAAEAGTLSRVAPVLTFQSIVDSTVLTGAVVSRLYDVLPGNGSELVMFDLDRQSRVQAFMPASVDDLYRKLFAGQPRKYRVSVVSNVSSSTAEAGEWDVPPGEREPVVRSIGSSWPLGVFSLSHIALPFRIDDPLYGMEPDTQEDFGVRLGRLDVRGERGVLLVSADDIHRLSCNPFFAHLESRLRQWARAAVK